MNNARRKTISRILTRLTQISEEMESILSDIELVKEMQKMPVD